MSASASESGRFYGEDSFDPKLIITQIVFIQASFTSIFGLAALLANILLGSEFVIWHYFRYQAYTFFSSEEWPTSIAFLLASLLTGVVVAFAVERSRKCADFVATFLILHSLVCFMNSGGVPGFNSYWILLLVAFIIATVTAEWLCVRKELEDIAIPQREGNAVAPSRTQPTIVTIV
uniref:Protein SYS1 homolog n=1 Tax=Chromera velia CCMP2878 TaxID=1169474 RepID=A0A0G4FYN6_9ALVE|mmetsp:Transcript_55527/g.108730  ORF Transcript_55527/g.108730 Transcript_55527/m.108730 type:complete len:177 (+) Transcript_55527:133-663(+)|eukprot:Cvel_19286.t1-p1 / transcript=Cvel_19286.t1 / gene=Cvel_19286 / organism=Chromera_velia_CCMP2878 / gene_product=Protein SYS1 homolog, putative / transcript_product=Protein SYS1 homolog, putative / location=Cvel_scaffold1651:19448-21786(+) / protein_length=176 / sequence_SO=supercontig / SO=protein_coding / is_pseudo=false